MVNNEFRHHQDGESESESDTNDQSQDNAELLNKPNAEFIRSDNSISSTTSRDLTFCINVVLKEAVKEDKLICQIFYTMLSAYSNNPLNLAINAPSGEGKSYVLKKVADLFPLEDVIHVTDMSSKAIFHRKGYLALRDEYGEYVNVEDELEQLTVENKTLAKKLENSNSKNVNELLELRKQLDENQKRINEIRKNAVKLIDLNRKILIFLDTPREGIFEALMTLLSHDKYEVEYQYVDSSNKTGLKTKINVLRGWPTVIFAQAIDYTKHPRYQEIQRRFIITNPRMDLEKYRSAIYHILEKKGYPDFVYQQKIISDADKDIGKEIVLNIRDDILSLSKSTKIGRNNTIVPFVHLIPRILQKNITAQDMTFTDRLMDIVGLLTIINHKKRPYMEIKPAFNSNTFRIPMSLYSDFVQALSLINNFHGGIRPYVLEWYSKVFLEMFNSKLEPNTKVDKEGYEITEHRIALTTQELIEKTKEMMNKILTSKSMLQEYVYPLLNTGYIDSIQSELDKRAKIYFPVLSSLNNKDEGKNSNLFPINKKNNLFDSNGINNVNVITTEDKNQIIFKIEEVFRYSSENHDLAALRFADSDVDYSIEEYPSDKTVQQIVDRYYSEIYIDSLEKPVDDAERVESVSKTSPSEEYFQTDKKEDILQNNSINIIKNNINDKESSISLFYDEKKNNILYSCYRCEFETSIQTEYERHNVLDHPGKPAYPSLADLEKDGLRPQGKHWE